MAIRVTQDSISVAQATPGQVRVTQLVVQMPLDEHVLPVRVTQLYLQTVVSLGQSIRPGVPPVGGTIQLMIPFVNTGFIGVAALAYGYAPRIMIEDRERNPYPASIDAVDVAEQQRVIREVHNKSQAGDSTFDYGLLLKGTPDRLYTLGSQGRFYHDDYGIIIARYVQFIDCIDTPSQGAPVGRLKTNQETTWVVTNDFSLSTPSLACGVMFLADNPLNETYGWVVVEGANPAEIDTNSLAAPTPGVPYTWSQTGQLAQGLPGAILGRRAANVVSGRIQPGDFFVRIEGESPALILSEIGNAKARLNAAELALIGLPAATADLQSGLAENSEQLAEALRLLGIEADARVRDVASIRDSLGGTDFTAAIAAGDESVREDLREAVMLLESALGAAGYTASEALRIVRGLDLSGLDQISGIIAQLQGLTNRINAIPPPGAITSAFVPLITGAIPAVFVQEPNGTLVLVEIML